MARSDRRSILTVTEASEPLSAPALKASEFDQISRFARDRFGLDLRRGKEELVSARLARRVREGGYKSYGAYFESALADRSGKSLVALIDALTTNHTSFLREPAHFEFLKASVLAQHTRGGPLRIWSAACSTGEEPYSIAGAVAVDAPSLLNDLKIFASDISSRALETAQRALYSENALAGAPKPWVAACFLRGKGESAGWYRVKPELTRLVTFRRLNLIEEIPIADRFDVIFCRNVMIYFDKSTQERVVRSLSDRLASGGHLFVGHSESLAGVSHDLTYVRPAIYRKARAGGREGRS